MRRSRRAKAKFETGYCCIILILILQSDLGLLVAGLRACTGKIGTQLVLIRLRKIIKREAVVK